MREAIGGLSLINIFVIFFIIISFILVGTVIYYKGYKINSRLINSLEIFEGYNEYSADDMDRVFKNLGYRVKPSDNCGTNSGTGESVACLGNNNQYKFKLSCSVSDKNKGDEFEGNNYYITYKVTTYIYIDLPLGFNLEIPVTTKSNPIYQFTGHENGLGC